jgi:Fur family transcriptional regulator, ferric uptake regulator
MLRPGLNWPRGAAVDRQTPEGRLRERGLRLTRERRRILEAALGHRGHFDADGLLAALRRGGAGVSRATVYRTLAHLVASGLLRRYDLGDRSSLYEAAVGKRHHEHLICLRCGAIIEFVQERIERLQDEVCRRHRFRPESHSLQIFGVCGSCAAREGTDV